MHGVARVIVVTCMFAPSPSPDLSRNSNSLEQSSELRSLIEIAIHPDLRWPEFSAYKSPVANFYGASSYSLEWTRYGRPTMQAQAVVAALETADAKGLDSEDYDGSRWSLRLSTLRQPGMSDRDLARFDLALTVSVMRYISDLHIGKVNPNSFHFGFDLAHKEYDPASLLRERLINAQDPRGVLDSIEPPFEGYRRTQTALQRYLRLAYKDDSERLPPLNKPLEPGGSYSGIPRLSRLLSLLGDLPENAVLSPDLKIYEPALVKAIERFQIRHGLDASGRIDARTLQQLNTPLARRVRQLQLTLERWRWVTHEFSRPPIVVNIPEFRARALNEAYLTELDMKVVVGKAYRHRTPAFSAELKYVIFRPYWDVPFSIQRAEIVPALERNRSHDAYRDFQIVSSKGTVAMERPMTDRTLADLRNGKLRLQQLPGPENSLGRVKFIFPNDNNVYLHDTPAKHLFSRSRRDFSHGCIRVEKPEALAAWVLRANGDWPPERIEAVMNGSETMQVNVKDPIPVLIVYATAVVLQGGEARFFPDIYGHDAMLETQLARPHP